MPGEVNIFPFCRGFPMTQKQSAVGHGAIILIYNPS